MPLRLEGVRLREVIVEVTQQIAPMVRTKQLDVAIDVVDTGIGIRQSDLHAIWEDFRQVDQSRTREFGGTGLRLSITRKLLVRLGGSVTVLSDYGIGSSFSVYLPGKAPSANLDELTPAAYPE